MALTLEDAHDHISLVTGGVPAKSATRYANEAGELLVGLRRWGWLEGAAASLDEVSGQAWLTLPANFDGIIGDPVPYPSSLHSFELVTPEQFEGIRQREIGVSFTTYGTISNLDDGGPPTPRIEIYPVPTADKAGAWSIRYRATWSRLDDDNTDLRIPQYCDSLFLDVLEAVALGREERDEGTVTQRLAGLHQWPSYMTAKKRDESQSLRHGRLGRGLIGMHKSRRRHSGVTWPRNGTVDLDA